MAHILLVEDNELNRDMLSRRLRRRGYEVDIAVDGADAIAAVAANRPDLILMDMSLPIMDGWAATKTLKSDPKTASIPVIALTAHAMAGEREKALGVGCDDYDTKPVEIRRLLKKMEVFLGKTTSNKAAGKSTRRQAAPSTAPALGTPAGAMAPGTPGITPAGNPASAVPVSMPAVAAASSAQINGLGTLLIVDDNPDNRDMLQRRLSRKGHTVLAVESGEEALACLESNTPNYQPIDMVLLDVMMPGMDGIETLQRIRQTYSPLQLPVIMVTAKDSNQDMLRAFDLGANDYITKPIDFDVAIARIQNQLMTVQAMRLQAATQQAPEVSPAPSPAPAPVESKPSEPAPVSFPEAFPEAQPVSPSPVPSFRPPASDPISFRPPAPMAEMVRDRLNGRYEVVQVLATDIFSQLLIAKDTQQMDQPLYFLKKINLMRLPFGSGGSVSKNQVVDFLEQDMDRVRTVGSHGYVTALVDFFVEDDAFFAVQEFVDGVLLADDFQSQGPLSFTQAVPLLKELFGTLDFIHQQRVAHGEIHTHHLMRRRADDRLVLIDFGLTQRVLNYLAPNSVAEIGFIQGYMPPEQCEGQLLFSSDVYALGMLMVQALTGKAPEYINRNVVTGELKWRELAEVDDKTAGVIQKMVCQNYAERYGYPEEASKDLLFQWYTLRFKRTLS